MNGYQDASVSTKAQVLIEVLVTLSVHSITKCFPSSQLSCKLAPNTDKSEITNEDELPACHRAASGD